MCDFLLSHVLFALPAGVVGKEREITTKSGAKLSYRLNRGDLQSIREVWCEEVYRLPFAAPSGALVDLGANIGLTTLWMATHYQLGPIVAVEPDPDNARLVQKNLEQNGLKATLIDAAVGPQDGTTKFQRSNWSNMGHVADDGMPIRSISMASILERFGLDQVGVAKIDIEGSEEAVFLGPSEWLQHVAAMVVEFHPEVVDYPRLTKTIASCGFDYIPASAGNMDCFLRAKRVCASSAVAS